MKLSLPCQHQGLFPTVIMVGPHFEQRQILVWNGLPHSWFPLQHRDLSLMIMSFAITFF